MIQPDEIIGRHYKVIAQLGVGGMGQVYKALDINLGRDVAVKFLLDSDSNEEIRQRFVNEGRTIATINHRAVISVYASDVDERLNVPFLVMEFVDGKAIDSFRNQYLANQTLLVEHFVELLEGISACHQKGIIHRDIKPANILVNREGQLKILDFGIAKTAKKQTKTGVALGTPHYMAPEQCLGKADVTHKVDIYAIGIMLWEFLSGKLPFDVGDSAADPALAIALMHLNEPPPVEVIRSNPAISRFADLLEKMLAKKPADRPEISDVLDVLRRELTCSIPAHATTTGIPAIPAVGVTPHPGSAHIIGDIYRIDRELGTGGMGTVYLALDTSLNRLVAVKVLNESMSRDENTVERFIREGQMLATVGHPNIMNIYASARDRDSGRPFLVMEYIDGVSLSSLKPSLLKDRRSVPSLMLQLFEGIAACHGKGIIHRDLKPSNIMVTRAGLLKVLDFGIAKTSAGITRTGVTMGTPEYMSPEQCMGVKDLTPASDIYTMGVIFWELLYGETPFKPDVSENPELSVALKHIHATLPATALIPDETIAPLLPMIRRMLDKSPQGRPSLDELLRTLDAYVDERLPSSATAPITRRKSRNTQTSTLQELVSSSESSFTRLFPWRWIFAGTLSLAAAAALYYGLNFGNPGNDKLIALLETQLRQQIVSDSLDEAVRSLALLEAEPKGPQAAAPYRSPLAEALSAKARTQASEGQASPAMMLYELALRVEPANATAAAGFAILKSAEDTRQATEARRTALLARTRGLLGLIGPGSGTDELFGLLDQLRREELASEAARAESDWIDAFRSSGDSLMKTDPARALTYFSELERRFPASPDISERVASAHQRIEEEKARLAKSQETAGLIKQLDESFAILAADSEPTPYVALCDRLASAGESATADNYRRNAAEKLFKVAGTKLASQDKAGAVAVMNLASRICADLPGLQEEFRRTEAEILADKAAAERAIRRATREKELVANIGKVVPPESPEMLLSAITEFEKVYDAASAAAEMRSSLQARYLAAATAARDREPEKAIVLFRQCRDIGPAPADIDIQIQSLQAVIASKTEALARQKRTDEIVIALPGLVKNPVGKNLNTVSALLDELSSLGNPGQAATFRAEALAVLKTRAGKVSGKSDAGNLISAAVKLAGADSRDVKEISSVIETALTARREARLKEIGISMGRFKPAENIKPAQEMLRELDSLEAPEQVATSVKSLKARFLDAAGRLKQPAQARKLLVALTGITQLKNDPDISSAIKSLDEQIAEETRRQQQESAASQAAKLPETPAKQPPDTIRPPVQPASPSLPIKPVEPTKPVEPEEPVVGPGGFSTLPDAMRAAKPGQTIRVKPGTYKGSTVIDKKVNIEGDGSRGAIILESDAGPVLTLSGNTVVSGLTIRYTGGSQTDAVKVTGGSPTLKNCAITSTAAAAAPTWSACIAVDGGSPTITGNACSRSKGMGILARGGRPKISGNTCTGCAIYGAWFTDGAKGDFENNTVTGNGKSGIGIKSGAAPLIRNNTISNNTENGIFVYQGGNGTIQNNTLSENGWSGVQVGMAGKADLIAGNRLTGNRRHGIHVTGNGSTAVIGSNTTSGNGSDAEKADSGGLITRR